MGLIVPVAGRYAGTYGNSNIGVLNDDGYELSYSPKGQEVNDTDAYGMTLVEVIYRGGDWRIRWKTKEWTSGMLGAFQIFGQLSSFAPALGIIGRKFTDMASALVLTVTNGTPAVGNPNTLTASQAILSPNSNISTQFTSKVREVPIEQVLLPYVSTGAIVPFTTT